MKERIALIWFSCFCCASENLRSMPAAAADSWIDFVFAVRHPLSAPTWEKPSTIFFSPVDSDGVDELGAADCEGAGAPPPPLACCWLPPEEPQAAMNAIMAHSRMTSPALLPIKRLRKVPSTSPRIF